MDENWAHTFIQWATSGSRSDVTENYDEGPLYINIYSLGMNEEVKIWKFGSELKSVYGRHQKIVESSFWLFMQNGPGHLILGLQHQQW